METMGDKAERTLRIVREAPIIAYDTETTGLDWKVNQPVGYVITADADTSLYIPVRHGGGGNLMDPHCGPMSAPDSPTVTHQYERDLAAAFEERRRRGFLTVGHNLKFDMLFSAKHGILLGRDCGDTQLNQAMLNEFTRSYSLDACCRDWGVTEKKGDEVYARLAALFGGAADKKQMEHYWRLPGNDEVGVDYAVGDGISTLELWQAQMAKIDEEEMSVIHRVESQLIWTLFRMEARGIRVDPTRVQAVTDEVKRQLDQARLKLPARFNERSGPQVHSLMKDNGHTDWPTTGKGNPSFPEAWLKKSDLGRAIIDVRKLSNLLNSFVTPLVENHVHEGRVHSALNQLKADDYGTISGRFSSSRPNLQQVPKRDKVLGRLFRSVFLPDDDMVFYEADYSQCEPRLFAHYSQEPRLVEGYRQSPPRDMHAVVADAFQVERDPTAKRMNMGILTGMQARTFAGHMDWSLDEATRQWNAWFAEFPGIRDFQNNAKRVFAHRGYVKTILGRRCRLEDHRFAYKAVSRIIQGSNADILKERMLAADMYLEAEGDQTHMLMTVHDSLEWQAAPGDLGVQHSAELVRICTDVQSAPFNLRVPFIMDVGFGESWAIATYGEPK